MAHRKLDLSDVYAGVRQHMAQIQSPYNDGYVSAMYKEELYHLKCWLEDEYQRLPKISGEEKWEQMRIVKLLKKSYQDRIQS